MEISKEEYQQLAGLVDETYPFVKTRSQKLKTCKILAGMTRDAKSQYYNYIKSK